ncbi:hypothetical protein LZD49_18330 [Dyadobacter sp. CY261]|uniref:hypothetical protein n=1 Tax=Dyadobacter sp. CY261 TaxID=2907203 RepID=UPI001F1886AF|nr:hypothetical protein [Dyadobacter sp. CY261]MCF0072446.1 hypothetical protein [Dyadobacter sp. CY261]
MTNDDRKLHSWISQSTVNMVNDHSNAIIVGFLESGIGNFLNVPAAMVMQLTHQTTKKRLCTKGGWNISTGTIMAINNNNVRDENPFSKEEPNGSARPPKLNEHDYQLLFGPRRTWRYHTLNWK